MNDLYTLQKELGETLFENTDFLDVDIECEKDENGRTIITKVEIDPLCLLSDNNVSVLIDILHDRYSCEEDPSDDGTEELLVRMKHAEIYDSYQCRCPSCQRLFDEMLFTHDMTNNAIVCIHCLKVSFFDTMANNIITTEETTLFNSTFSNALEKYELFIRVSMPQGYENYEKVLGYLLEKSISTSIEAKMDCFRKGIKSYREIKSLLKDFLHEQFFYLQIEQKEGYKLEVLKRLKEDRDRKLYMLFLR